MGLEKETGIDSKPGGKGDGKGWGKEAVGDGGSNRIRKKSTPHSD